MFNLLPSENKITIRGFFRVHSLSSNKQREAACVDFSSGYQLTDDDDADDDDDDDDIYIMVKCM